MIPHWNILKIKWLEVCKVPLSSLHIKIKTQRKFFKTCDYFHADWFLCFQEVLSWEPSWDQLTLYWVWAPPSTAPALSCIQHDSKAKKWPITKDKWYLSKHRHQKKGFGSQTDHYNRVQFMIQCMVQIFLAFMSLYIGSRRRKWQPTPVLLPGESQAWGCRESDMTEVT